MPAVEIPSLPRRTSPILVRRWLGGELERLRLQADLTQVAAAKALGWGRSKTLYIESGERPISVSDLETKVFPTYQVPAELRGQLIQMAKAANARAWWDAYDEEDLPKPWKEFTGIEHGARSVRTFEGVTLPGLLQTEDYAKAVTRTGGRQIKAVESLEKIVEVRRKRQELLTAQDPLELSVVLDENVLHRPAGSTEIMRRQLEHVADTAEGLPNVTVQVIEFSTGVHAAAHGSFSILDFPWPDDPGMVFLETGPTGVQFLDTRRDVYLHSEVFDRLLEDALGSQESVDILRRVATKFR